MITKEFLLAGDATFTVSNAAGDHFTYKVNSIKNDETGNKFFVSFLSGPDNTIDYSYMGLLFGDTGKVIVTRKSHTTVNSTVFKVFQFALQVILKGRELPAGYGIQHAGKCGRCGRKLTTPESIETGLGPVCRERM